MSVRFQLTVTISLLIAIAFGVGGTLMITTSFQDSLETETRMALDSFTSVGNTLHLLSELGEEDGLADTLEQMDGQGTRPWQALTLASEGELLFRSGGAGLLDYALPTPEEGQCAYVPVEDAYGRGLVVLGRLPAGETELVLMARFDLSGVYQTRETQQRVYAVIYVSVVLSGILAAGLLAGALTRPLRKLTATVACIAEGDLSTRSEIRSRDEIGRLSRDFDAMADKLQATIGRLEEDMQRQERFMGAFAHELKTPMTSIIGFADLLRQDHLDENTRLMAADHIFSEGRRLEQLAFKLQDLLLLGQGGFRLHPVALQPLLAEVERAVAPMLRQRGHRLVCKVEPGRAVLEPDLVKSLLYNLIDNAAKAMDTPDTVTVTAKVIPGGCRFQVADSGRGMSPEELEKVTEPFYRVDKARSRSQGGAGLGLALCREIVSLHRGELRFASAPGKGTRVTVTLLGEEADAND